MLKKLAHYAAVAALVSVPVFAVTACSFSSFVSEVGGLVGSNVPTNVSQGATEANVIISGLENGLAVIGVTIPADVQADLAQAQTAVTAIASATSNDTAAPLLQQFEVALNAAVGAMAQDKSLPTLAQSILTAAQVALPAIEALIPVPASSPAGMHRMAATSPATLESANHALLYLGAFAKK
jgi:hypothetical protein